MHRRQMEARAEDAQFGHMVEKIERCAKCIARKEECARCRKCAGGKPVSAHGDCFGQGASHIR